MADDKCCQCLISRFRCRELHRAEVLALQTDHCRVMGVFMCIYTRDNLSHGLFPILPICLPLKGGDQAGRQDVDEITGRAQAPIRSCPLDRHLIKGARRADRSDSRQTPPGAVSPIWGHTRRNTQYQYQRLTSLVHLRRSRAKPGTRRNQDSSSSNAATYSHPLRRVTMALRMEAS